MHNQTITPPQAHMHAAHSSPDIVHQHQPNFTYPVPNPNPTVPSAFEPVAPATVFPNSVYDVFTIPQSKSHVGKGMVKFSFCTVRIKQYAIKPGTRINSNF